MFNAKNPKVEWLDTFCQVGRHNECMAPDCNCQCHAPQFQTVIGLMKVTALDNLRAYDLGHAWNYTIDYGFYLKQGVELLAAIDILRIARGDSFALPVLKENSHV